MRKRVSSLAPRARCVIGCLGIALGPPKPPLHQPAFGRPSCRWRDNCRGRCSLGAAVAAVEDRLMPTLELGQPIAHRPVAASKLVHLLPDLGMKALQFSATAALDDGSEENSKPVSSWMMAAQAIFSVLFFIGLYKVVPLKLTDLLATWLPALKNQILFNLVDADFLPETR